MEITVSTTLNCSEDQNETVFMKAWKHCENSKALYKYEVLL